MQVIITKLKTYSPIGVFDSGYGGLTILKELVHTLPQYDYLYLGDNARAPYGSRSFDTVYEYTLQCVKALFEQGCELVILACNTASAKALRTIQQKDLPLIDSNKRVLGVIRPTTEIVGNYTKTNEVGIFATSGTVTSESYLIEIEKFFPQVKVYQEACPMWVPLIENNELEGEGANYFVEKHVKHLFSQSKNIDTVVLGCTHYPLIYNEIKQYYENKINIIDSPLIVANYVYHTLRKHKMLASNKNPKYKFYFSDITPKIEKLSKKFFGNNISLELKVL